MVETSSSSERLHALLNSFICAQEEITDENIERLTQFVNSQQIGEYSSEFIHEKVKAIQDEDHRVQQKHQDIAALFTPDHMVRRIRFGSAFCPNCYMFKNFDKECLYCQHLEVTY